MTATGRRPLRVLAIAGAVLVLVAIGWLVWPRSPAPVVLNAGTPQHLVTVTIDSLRIGDTAVDVTVTDRAGTPIDHAAVQVQAIQPLMGHAGPPVPASSAGSGRFRAAAVSLMMTGPWELRLSIDAHHGVDQLTLPLWVGG
ncbi:FixH family protein [Nocardia iowensis]|uniref:FixH family protein n=1 Tax=Nocardia iowensis TaxID=204891 RepID=A0ABX8RYP2_NOCIO|nr:FixH family protein [Nocardia iowensis]QXN93977.1 FixH family protein [Nocardia iowensis]